MAPKFPRKYRDTATGCKIFWGQLIIVLVHSFLALAAVIAWRRPDFYARWRGDEVTVNARSFLNFGQTPLEVVFLLSTFLTTFVGLWIVMRGIHKRSVISLFGTPSKFCWFSVCVGLAIKLGINIVVLSADSIFNEWEPWMREDLPTWILWFLPTVLLLLLMAVAVQLGYQGYLLNMLWSCGFGVCGTALAPPIIFGLFPLSGRGSFGKNSLVVYLTTVVDEILLNLVTLNTGNLSAGIGLRWGQLVSGVLIQAKVGKLDGMALWRSDMDLKSPEFAICLLISAVLSILVYDTIAPCWFGQRWPISTDRSGTGRAVDENSLIAERVV